jgi:hypothetical protein
VLDKGLRGARGRTPPNPLPSFPAHRSKRGKNRRSMLTFCCPLMSRLERCYFYLLIVRTPRNIYFSRINLLMRAICQNSVLGTIHLPTTRASICRCAASPAQNLSCTVPGRAPAPSRLPHSASYCSQVLITVLDRNLRSLAS